MPLSPLQSCASVAGSNGKEAQQPSDRLGNDDKDDDVTPSASSVTPSSRKQGRDSLKTLSSDGGRSPANKDQSDNGGVTVEEEVGASRVSGGGRDAESLTHDHRHHHLDCFLSVKEMANSHKIVFEDQAVARTAKQKKKAAEKGKSVKSCLYTSNMVPIASVTQVCTYVYTCTCTYC